MTIVNMKHLRALKYCSRGVRKFFINNGLDYSSFLKHGVDGEVLLKTNDSMAKKAVQLAEAENGR